MEKSDLIELVRNEKPLWDQRQTRFSVFPFTSVFVPFLHPNSILRTKIETNIFSHNKKAIISSSESLILSWSLRALDCLRRKLRLVGSGLGLNNSDQCQNLARLSLDRLSRSVGFKAWSGRIPHPMLRVAEEETDLRRRLRRGGGGGRIAGAIGKEDERMILVVDCVGGRETSRRDLTDYNIHRKQSMCWDWNPKLHVPWSVTEMEIKI
jgi:hypothetical protein